MPDPPENLTDGAKAYWRDLTPALAHAEILKPVDLAALSLLCSCLDEVDRCEAVLAKDGLTVTQTNKSGFSNVARHPLIAVRNTARTQAVALLKSFGMTPAVRGLRGLRLDSSPSPLRIVGMSDAELEAEAIVDPESGAAEELKRRSDRREVFRGATA